VGPQQCGVVVPAEGELSGQALVQDAAQGVDVRAVAHRLALDLLGGDIVDGAEEVSGARQPTRQLRRSLGEAEVGEVHVAAAGGPRALLVGDEDVARLDVTVHQPGPVGGVQRTTDLAEQPQGPLHR
jgi:hypothetical protein